MDKIKKFLKKLSKKEQEAFLLLMYQIKKNYKQIPGIKKLKGKKHLYRIRLGKYRIIFSTNKKDPEIIKITKRNEETYKQL
jgi:mRNA-degrading endonuclease RelE of RelBE toxin-antitoxin system